MTTTYKREDIHVKAKEIARMMAETEEIDFFKRAEKQINEHAGVQEMIAKIKKHQKEAVNLQHYGKSEALKEVESKIDQIQADIDAIPLVQEFKQSQLEVNELLQMVSNTISRTVTDEIITSMGGDLLKGTTTKSSCSSGGCGCE